MVGINRRLLARVAVTRVWPATILWLVMIVPARLVASIQLAILEDGRIIHMSPLLYPPSVLPPSIFLYFSFVVFVMVLVIGLLVQSNSARARAWPVML